MSPGNSYFKDREVAFLLKETLKKYWRAVIMVADIPAISTYLAMWYNPSKARQKAVLKANSLKNRTKKVLDLMWLDSSKVTIVNRDQDIKENAVYLLAYESILQLYQNNNAFKVSVDTTSANVLQNAGQDITQENIAQATHYLLSEIAFLEFAPDYFGVNKIWYVYHKNRFVFEDYVAWLFDGKIRSYLEFILLEAPYETIKTDECIINRRELIKKRGVLRCSYVPYYWFFEKKGDGSYEWMFYEVIQWIAKKYWLKLDFVEQSGYGTLPERLNSWWIDVFCSPTRPTEIRKMEMFFSSSLFQSNVFLYMNRKSRYSTQDLHLLQENQKLRIAVKENDVHFELAVAHFPHATLVRVPQLSHISEVMEIVASGRADMTFWDEELVYLYAKTYGINESLFIKRDRYWSPLATYQNCFALPWGEFELKEILDAGITDIA